jgi:hypothetical protein
VFIFSTCRFLESREEALEAELRSYREGLELAIQQMSLQIIIDSDCSQFVVAFLHSSQDYTHLILEFKSLASFGKLCKFVKVDRGQVRVSHCLANWARIESRTFVRFVSARDVDPRELELELRVIPTV